MSTFTSLQLIQLIQWWYPQSRQPVHEEKTAHFVITFHPCLDVFVVTRTINNSKPPPPHPLLHVSPCCCWFGPNRYTNVTDPNDRGGNKSWGFSGLRLSASLPDMASPSVRNVERQHTRQLTFTKHLCCNTIIVFTINHRLVVIPDRLKHICLVFVYLNGT